MRRINKIEGNSLQIIKHVDLCRVHYTEEGEKLYINYASLYALQFSRVLNRRDLFKQIQNEKNIRP